MAAALLEKTQRLMPSGSTLHPFCDAMTLNLSPTPTSHTEIRLGATS